LRTKSTSSASPSGAAGYYTIGGDRKEQDAPDTNQHPMMKIKLGILSLPILGDKLLI